MHQYQIQICHSYYHMSQRKVELYPVFKFRVHASIADPELSFLNQKTKSKLELYPVFKFIVYLSIADPD